MSKTITLNDSTSLPYLAFGTGTALFKQSCTQQVEEAIKAGFVHIDAAEMYENEEGVGEAIKGVDRSKLFITTKSGGKDVRASLDASLKKLGLDYVDLFLIHSPIITDAKTQWTVMEQLQQEGKAKSIGVSNFRVSDLKTVLDVCKVKPAINQIEYHPSIAAAAEPLIAFHKEQSIAVAMYGNLVALRKPELQHVKTVAEEIAKERNITSGQVLQLWSRAKTGGEIVTTSSKPDRMKEQLTFFDLEPLSEEHVKKIDQAGKEKHVRCFMEHMDDQ